MIARLRAVECARFVPCVIALFAILHLAQLRGAAFFGLDACDETCFRLTLGVLG